MRQHLTKKNFSEQKINQENKKAAYGKGENIQRTYI